MLNCNSINTKLGEIKDFLVDKKPDIFCFTETWLTSYIPKFHNYSSHWKNRNQGTGGGLGILVAAGLSHRSYPLILYDDGHLEVQAVTVDTGRSSLVILNVYNPNKNLTIAEIEFYVNQLGNKYLIMGDFNAHTPILTSTDTASNQTGKTLEHLLTNYNICLNNPFNFYTYLDRRSGRQSCLDLCLSSPNLSTSISMKHQRDLGSDHKTIQILLNTCCTKVEAKKIPKWKITDTTA